MLKKTVVYENADGVTVSKDLYFNISANELIKKEAESGQTFGDGLQKIASSDDLKTIYPTVIDMMGYGYGLRTEDGDFEKDPTGLAWKKFQTTMAYEALMDELLLNPDNNGNRLADFINSMLPSALLNQIAEKEATPGFRPGASTDRPTPPSSNPQPIPVAPMEPVVQEMIEPSVIVQSSEPRTPDLPGQMPQQ